VAKAKPKTEELREFAQGQIREKSEFSSIENSEFRTIPHATGFEGLELTPFTVRTALFLRK
jgi:hypothetical protein